MTPNIQAARIAISGRGEWPSLSHFTNRELRFVLTAPLLSQRLRELAAIERANRIAHIPAM
jgi:hypothetical protein